MSWRGLQKIHCVFKYYHNTMALGRVAWQPDFHAVPVTGPSTSASKDVLLHHLLHTPSIEFSFIWIKQDYRKASKIPKIFKLALAEIRLILPNIIKTSFDLFLRSLLCLIPYEMLQYNAKRHNKHLQTRNISKCCV